VAIYGSAVVVGAPSRRVGNASGEGAAYVFVRSGPGWSQQAELTASDGINGDGVGQSVAIYKSTAVVGTNVSNRPTGAAYVFVHSGSSWSQQAKLTAADGSVGDLFGWSVAVSGSTAVVSAPGHRHVTGAAYVFVRSGTSWSQRAELVPSDAAPGHGFGFGGVAISGPNLVAGGDASANAAYLFTRSGTAWSEQAKLASGGGPDAFFGDSVSIQGSTAVVGAPDSGPGGAYSRAGSAYVFGGL
jgi:hypothetical protein